MGGGGMGGMGGGGMGGMFRVNPDRPGKLKVPCVCLEHGKQDPNPRMKYQVVRLAKVNDSPIIEQLCQGLGSGKVSQNVVQAAAWHVANGLSWEELAKKPKVISEYTGVKLFFSHFEVQAALRLTEQLKNDGKSSTNYSSNETVSSMGKRDSESRDRSR